MELIGSNKLWVTLQNVSRNVPGNIESEQILINDPLNISLQNLSAAYTMIFFTFCLSHCVSKFSSLTSLASLNQIVKIILVNFTLLLFSPLILIIFSCNFLARTGLSFLFKTVYGGSFNLLDARDAAWAPESFAHCNHFTALYILEGECDLTNIQKLIREKLFGLRGASGELVYEKMTKSVGKKFGYYCWEKRGEIAIENHVKLLDEKVRDMSEDQLFEYFQKTADVPMTDEIPQWEILLLPKFMYKNKGSEKISESRTNHFAVVFKIHHSIMDGVSAGQALKHVLADRLVKFTVDPLAPLNIPPVIKYLAYFKCLLLGPTLLIDALLLRERNSFHKTDLTGPKSFGWSKPVSLDALKKIKNSRQTTTTSVLISSVGGSLHNLAQKKTLLVPKTVQMGATIAMLPYPSITPTNRFVAIQYPLDVGLRSSEERLESANGAAKRLAVSPLALAAFVTISVCTALPAVLGDFLISCMDATVLLSNVPGPAEPAYLFGGHLMTDVVSWVPLKNTIGIGVCLFSYAGRIRANFVTDKSAMPGGITDLTDLITGFETELINLARVANVPVNELFLSQLQSPIV